MSKFTKEMVDNYANKLLIGLTEEENKLVLDEFEQIDKQIDLINEIPNIENITPMTHALDNFVTFLRDDEAKTSDDIDDILANAKDIEGREIQIPKVVD